MNDISVSALRDLFLADTPLIDVRAPVEFHQGSLPNAINLPIMNDEERALVGTTYKQAGREEAIRLGHSLVAGEKKESRLHLWQEQIRQHPATVLYCFRGGLRSKITQAWLKEAGTSRPLIVGGYKTARNFLMEQTDRISTERIFLMLSGPTGSAKTHLLEKLQRFHPAVDLEALALHRGSAFGGKDQAQPSQIDFENRLSVSLLKLESDPKKILVEDESRMIGKLVIPESFFLRMRQSSLILVHETFEQRVENIFQDYVVATALQTGDEARALAVFDKFDQAVHAISRRLGGLRTQEIQTDLKHSRAEYVAGRGLDSNRIWIEKLLKYYYDPLYQASYERRQPDVLFKGNSLEILQWMTQESEPRR